MKGALLWIAIFALSMLVIPMIAVSHPRQEPMPAAVHIPQTPPAAVSSPQTQSEALPDAPQAPPELPEGVERTEASRPALQGVAAFRVLDETTGEVHTVAAGDYIRGAVAAEMPAGFHSEALKAQGVAAHTYALHRHWTQAQSPDPQLKGADFAADPSHMKGYITEEKAREFYGDKADEYWDKICAAADSVAHLALEYEGEPIVAAYHAISAGVTEDASHVWVGSAAYLRPVESEGDYLAPDYETEAEFSYSELKERLLEEYPELELSGRSDSWFGELERSPSGYVTSIAVGGQTLHGSDLRRVLELRSHSFDLIDTGSGFLFVVYGYGHGVGLSQYGADFMARQGAGFAEILERYYTGAALAQVEPPR